MKKDLLFIIPSLSAGGGEKSLVNLLSQINFRDYNVDLFLFEHNGLFMEFLPKEVNVLPLPEKYKIFSLPLFQSIKKFFYKGEIKLIFDRVMFSIINRVVDNVSLSEQRSWGFQKNSLECLNKQYDVSIGFLEKTSTYFCVEKVNAKKKIGWVHVDYDRLGMDPKFDINYFKNLENIVTVSQECAKILENRFPSEKKKIKVIYNVVSPTMINNMANGISEDVYNKKPNEIVILSIGRLHYQKNFELAIHACKKLVEKGYNIKWNVIGEGEERKKLEDLISENHLENHFTLLGLKSNPYPYLKQSDIYAQTSRFEGKSIAIDEAKILNKPIVVTNFPTAKDQITHKVDGLIVDLNVDSVVNGVETLIFDVNIRNELMSNLSKVSLGTENEINKLYQLCN